MQLEVVSPAPFAGGAGLDTEAATDWPAWLDTSINGVASMTAEKPTPSSRSCQSSRKSMIGVHRLYGSS